MENSEDKTFSFYASLCKFSPLKILKKLFCTENDFRYIIAHDNHTLVEYL